MHTPYFSDALEMELPPQLFPSFKPTEMKTVDSTSLLPPVVAAAAAAAGHSAGPEDAKSASASSFQTAVSSFRSSLSGAALASFVAPSLPLASLRLPAPTVPLLSRGVGRSSSHLSLVALDPESSVLQPGVLHRLKLSVIKGEARGVSGKEERDADAALPSAAPGLRKRGSSKLSSVSNDRVGEETHKKQKKVQLTSTRFANQLLRCSCMLSDVRRLTRSDSFLCVCSVVFQLPLVPKQSLLTLDTQLSRDKSSAASAELAAFALARHLVDWAEGFNIEPDEDEEEEEPETARPLVVSKAASGAIGSLPRMPEVDSVPPAEWMVRAESESQGHAFTYSTPDCHSAASTPAFEPPMSRSGSSASLATITPPDNEHEFDSLHHAAAAGATTEGRLHDLCVLQQADTAGSFLFPSATFSPLVSAHGNLPQLTLLPQLSLGLSSALASPKVSPALLAHLSSPEERAAMLSFHLDDHSSHPPDGGQSSPLLAHTTTSTGARVALVQHMHSHQQEQLSW